MIGHVSKTRQYRHFPSLSRTCARRSLKLKLDVSHLQYSTLFFVHVVFLYLAMPFFSREMPASQDGPPLHISASVLAAASDRLHHPSFHILRLSAPNRILVFGFSAAHVWNDGDAVKW